MGADFSPMGHPCMGRQQLAQGWCMGRSRITHGLVIDHLRTCGSLPIAHCVYVLLVEFLKKRNTKEVKMLSGGWSWSDLARLCWHGEKLSRRPSCTINGLVLDEIRRCLVHREHIQTGVVDNVTFTTTPVSQIPYFIKIFQGRQP